MSTRISQLREECKQEGNDQVIPKVKEILLERWNLTANSSVHQLQDSQNRFKIKLPERSIEEKVRTHVCDMNSKTRTCAKWQECEMPCLHAMVYYRIWEDKDFDMILSQNLSDLYKLKTQKELLSQNIEPVVTDNLKFDLVTLPPIPITKEQLVVPGRKGSNEHQNTLMTWNHLLSGQITNNWGIINKRVPSHWRKPRRKTNSFPR
mmetsp:Transcript_3222/g.4762  ORF Transcript_3222/g.4762 Transcript_3222/m.4762 type:complete len:206 (-) Transcript_3222:116-733(-)